MDLPNDALWDAFRDGHRFATVAGPQEMRCYDAGSLVLPSGQIVFCDPQFDLVQSPFSVRVNPGEYPLFLSLTEDSEIALVMIRFADGVPTHWSRAKPQSASVDSGTACFIDAKLARLLLRAADHGRFDKYWKRVEDEMEENGGFWGNICLHNESGANMLAIRTIGGDGTFFSYLGFSDDDELVCLVTDFFLFERVVDGTT